MIRILIVEDELIIAEDMSNMLSNMGYHITGIAMDFEEALQLIDEQRPDLILLDVNLGGKKDGIHLAEVIHGTYHIPFIFTTSYSDTATLERAKKTNPVNYLVKPFKQEQLFTAIEISWHKLANSPKSEESMPTPDDALIIKDSLFIKDKFKYTKLVIADILWIKSEGNYLEIHTVNKEEIIRASLNNFIERLNKTNFFRTHKSYIINLDFLTKFETSMVTVRDIKIPITKSYAEELIKRLNIF